MNTGIDRRQKIQSITLLAVCFAFFTALYWRFVVEYPGPAGSYYSDICEHLLYGKTYGIKGEYSLTLLINDILLKCGSLGSWLVAAHIALIVVMEIVFGCLFIKKTFPEGNLFIMMILSLFALMVIPVYLPLINSQMYTPFSGNNWHSENYHGMRAISVLFFIFLIDIVDDYLERFSVKQMLISAVLLSVINAIKPNFILGIAPALLVMMIADIIKSKGHGIKHWFMFGISVLLSLPVLLWQYFVNFDPSVETSENTSLFFVFGGVLTLEAHPFLEFILGMAFPISVLIIHRRIFRENKFYRLCLAGLLFAFLELFFIAESGERFYDGNMGWGFEFFIYFIFLICISVYYRNIVTFLADKKRRQSLTEYCMTRKKEALKLLIPGLLLIWHIGCGLLYFAIVCAGETGYLI